MFVKPARAAAVALAIASALATGGTAAAQSPAVAPPKADPTTALKAPTRALAVKPGAKKPPVRAGSRSDSGRGQRRARSGYTFHSCNGWKIVNGYWAYDCFWKGATSSSAPAGAHIIGWASSTQWYFARYYLGRDGGRYFWHGGYFTA